MSLAYEYYLKEHRDALAYMLTWIKDNTPELLLNIPEGIDFEHQILYGHDESKKSMEEYEAYDTFYYTNNQSYQALEDFNAAWLHHIHNNPHHWQHWVLIVDDVGGRENADVKNGINLIEIPYHYILEMVMDWFTFGVREQDMYSTKKWYAEHKHTIKLNSDSRKVLESILDTIYQRLDQDEGDA